MPPGVISRITAFLGIFDDPGGGGSSFPHPPGIPCGPADMGIIGGGGISLNPPGGPRGGGGPPKLPGMGGGGGKPLLLLPFLPSYPGNCAGGTGMSMGVNGFFGLTTGFAV